MFTYLTAGESHGPALVAVIEGLPAGLDLHVDGLASELARRRLGFGRGARMALERDEIEILGGVRHGRTLGSPIAVAIRNTEYQEKWAEEMSPHPGTARRPLTTPRPGHADLTGMIKYATRDARDILERASARETAARTVVGHVCKVFLDRLGIAIVSHVVEIGGVSVPDEPVPGPDDQETIDASPVRVFDRRAEAEIIERIEAARAARDTLGGVVEVLAYGLLPGLGSHVHWNRRIDARLAEALMSIQAIKGVEIGDGFRSARRTGSEAHDEIFHQGAGFHRQTNRAGGTEGGMTIGTPLRVRAAMKPISTVGVGLRTVDIDSKAERSAFYERSDVVAVPAAGVVAEQMVAIVLTQEIQRKFGGDTIDEVAEAWKAYRARVEAF